MHRTPGGFASGDPITPELTALRLLGGGSAYEAFLAFDEITYAPVVVKVVRPAQVSDEGTLRGLRREVETLEQVNHPAVVRVLRAELDGARPHVVLEQLDGPRLSTLIRRYGALEPAQYLPLGIEIASALHYFRRLELTHLDVKPSNVIMGAPAKLIDLSVARPAGQAARLTYPVGTDSYMAPSRPTPAHRHRRRRVRRVGARRHALRGGRRLPRVRRRATEHSEDLADRFPQLRDEPHALPEHVPSDVAEVVASCLAFDPADRPTPAEVADALGPVLAPVRPQGQARRLQDRPVALNR